MRLSRKIVGFGVALALFATQFTPVMATAPADMGNVSGTVDDTTGGAGNILYNSVDKVVVPTTLRFVLNPKKYTVIKRFVPAAVESTDAPAPGTDYYIVSKTSHKYELYEFGDSETTFATALTTSETGKVYTYTAGTDDTDDQIISLNYGIINKSTASKVVKADIKVSYSETNASGKDVVFVDTAAKATSKKKAETVTGASAETNEPKIFLQVKSTSEAVKVRETYKRATVPASIDTDQVYYCYKKTGDVITGYDTIDHSTNTTAAGAATAGGTFADLDKFKVAYKALKGDVFTFQAYNASGQAVEPDTNGAQLSDAAFNLATGGAATFETPEAGITAADAADASVTYLLTDAEYDNRSTALLTWETTSLGEEILYCKSIKAKGSTGFTITGAMNDDCDWTKIKTTALKITPKYTIRDLASNETTTDVANTYNQVTINRSPSVTTTARNILVTDTDATINVDLGEGSLKATTVNNVIWTSADGSSTDDLLTNGQATFASNVLTIKAATVNYLINHAGDKIEVVFDDDTTTPTKVELVLTEQ